MKIAEWIDSKNTLIWGTAPEPHYAELIHNIRREVLIDCFDKTNVNDAVYQNSFTLGCKIRGNLPQTQQLHEKLSPNYIITDSGKQ